MANKVWVACIGNLIDSDKTKTELALTNELELQTLDYDTWTNIEIKRYGKMTVGRILASTGEDTHVNRRDTKDNKNYVYIANYEDEIESYDDLKVGEQKIFDAYFVPGQYEYYDIAFQKFKEKGLEKLLKHTSFSYVNYNEDTGEYFACSGKKDNCDNSDSKIYYCFLNDDKSNIIMSNDRNVIINQAGEIYELPDNSYMVNGEIKSLITKIEVKQEQEETEDNPVDMFTEMLYKLVDDIADGKIEEYEEKLVESLEQIMDKYIAEFNVNKIISKKQRDFLIDDVKKAVFLSIRNDIKVNNVVDIAIEKFEEKIKNGINEKIDEYMSTIYVPKVHVITRKDNSLKQVEGVFHENFPDILSSVELNEPTMLVGPAGSGKNVAVGQVADALDLKMYYTNNANNEFKLLGYMDATGKYHETPFYKAFTQGGVFFLDEIDASDPAALIVVNSGLANGYMFFPNSSEPVEMNPDFRIVAAANTWGKGADLQYVGRNALDGSTMDRFDTIFFDYDEKMESVLYPDDEILEFMWNFRKAVFDTKTPHIVSTRGIKKVYSKKINGVPVEKAVSQNIVKGLSTDYLSLLIGKLDEMETVKEDNEYLQNVKKLVLKPTQNTDFQLVDDGDDSDEDGLPF